MKIRIAISVAMFALAAAPAPTFSQEKTKVKEQGKEKPAKKAAPAPPPPPPEPDRDWFGPTGRNYLEWSTMTGDWAGLRTTLEESGVTIAGSATFDWSHIGRGGVGDREDAQRTLLDYNATFDLDKFFGIPGATVFLDAYSFHGESGSDTAGDFQAYSNIDLDSNLDFQIGELWWQQVLFEEKLRLKIGKVDSNSEFGQPISAGDFIHSSSAFPQTASEMPLYPNPAMGINAFLYPMDRFSIGLGWYDGEGFTGKQLGKRGVKTFFDNDPGVNDYFGIVEVGYTWPNSSAFGWARAVAGTWTHTGDFAKFDGSTDRGNVGHYLFFEKRLWKTSRNDDADERGLRAFLQYDWADPKTHLTETHFGAGLVLNGTHKNRPDDAVGVYFSLADFSDAILDRAAGCAIHSQPVGKHRQCRRQ